MAFDSTTRGKLQRLVAACRKLLTDDFDDQLQSLYGIYAQEGRVLDLEKLASLDDDLRMTGALLRERIAHLQSGLTSSRTPLKDAVQRVLREQAFTVLNRFAALRMAEERELVLQCVGDGLNSKGFQVFESLASHDLGSQYERYCVFLGCLFDELSLDLGVLFDRFSPFGLLFPREPKLKDFLQLLNDPELKSLWREDETIGWIYQYFNDEAERKKMREESSAPRNSRELAVRNQFFTPRYVVEFLTDNTLGRLWYEMTRAETTLRDRCGYLVRRPTEIFLKPGESAAESAAGSEAKTGENLSQEELLRQPIFIPHRPLKDPREIRLLDPACGSMHFGLYAFDLFTVIYEEWWDVHAAADQKAQVVAELQRFDGTSEQPIIDEQQRRALFVRHVPRLIIGHNIHGIDIDPRCAQIAGLSLWLRAQRAWHQAGVKPVERPRITRSNLVCAEPMPGEKELLREFVEQQFPAGERPAFAFLLEKIFDRMTLAGEAGSLLRIEEEIRAAIIEARALAQSQSAPRQARLFPGDERPEQAQFDLRELNDEQFWQAAEQRIYDALEAYAGQAENGGGFQRRLFADDAAQGFAFIDLCRKRYDAVVMNPPFGLFTEQGLIYAKINYPDASNDLYAAFSERSIASLSPGGRLGIISSRLGFFLDGLKKWRQSLMCDVAALRTIADLGYGVLDAVVETAAYVIDQQVANDQLIAISALHASSKTEVLQGCISRLSLGESSRYTFLSRLRILRRFPGSVLGYWLPRGLVTSMTRMPIISRRGVSVFSGLQSDDDFRFLRLWWECPQPQLTKGWIAYAKGGEYQPFADDLHLVVNWFRHGEEMQEFVASKYTHWSRHIKNTDRYFISGLTYTERTTSDVSIRPFPKNAIFGVKGPVLQSDDANALWNAWALLTSRVGRLLIDMAVGSGDTSRSGTAARDYRTGVLASIPCPEFSTEESRRLAKALRGAYKVNLALQREDEAHWLFCLTPVSPMSTGREVARERWLKRIHDFNAASLYTHAIESIVSASFALSEDEIASLAGPHPCDKGKTTSAGVLAEVEHLLGLDEAALCAAALEKGVHPRTATKKCYYYSRQFELICSITGGEVDAVTSALEVATNGLDSLIEKGAEEIVSMCLGVSFGRWDIRYATGERPAPELPDPFAPLPVCPPGMLQGDDGLPLSPEAGRRLRAEGSYPLDVAWGGILVDDPEHPLDIERRVHAALAVLWGGRADALEHEACAVLGVPTLREWFRRPTGFFADHLKRYSKSRRQAPIYWPVSTPSGSYTLWLYYHRLNAQTLYTCVTDFVKPKLDTVTADADRLQARTQTGSTAKERAELQELRDFQAELQELNDELLRVAQLPWKPNLNDGVLITASPLWRLFCLPKWQKGLKACWEELAAGDYDWAHLAYTIRPDHVREKCKTDRSLAIAHGLEDLCEVEAPKPKTKRGKKGGKLEKLF